MFRLDIAGGSLGQANEILVAHASLVSCMRALTLEGSISLLWLDLKNPEMFVIRMGTA